VDIDREHEFNKFGTMHALKRSSAPDLCPLIFFDDGARRSASYHGPSAGRWPPVPKGPPSKNPPKRCADRTGPDRYRKTGGTSACKRRRRREPVVRTGKRRLCVTCQLADLTAPTTLRESTTVRY
jgi:hypothetical protein